MKEVTPIIITLVIAALAILFRHEIRKLVVWIVGFRHIAKTKDGFALIAASEPGTPAPLETKDPAESIVESTAIQPVNATESTESEFSWVLAMNKKQYDEALLKLRAQYESEKDLEERIQIRAYMAHVEFERDARQGVAEFEKLIEEFSTNSVPYFWFALTLTWKELNEKAIEVLERGIAKARPTGRLHESLSDLYVKVGNIAKAIDAARNGVRSQPDYFENYINLARIYAKKKEIDTARLWYLKALQMSNNDERVLASYASFLFDHSLINESIFRYQQLISANADNPTYRGLLGNAYVDAGLMDFAYKEYKKALDENGNRAGWLLANIGNVFNRQALYSESVRFLKEALEVDPDSEYAHTRLVTAMKNQAKDQSKLNELLAAGRQAAAEGAALASRLETPQPTPILIAAGALPGPEE